MNKKVSPPLQKIIFISLLLLWITVISCLGTITFFATANRNIFSYLNKLELPIGNNKADIENLMLKPGEIMFENKKAFVINTFRYKGVEEKLPFEINMRKEPQKFYDYIYEKKTLPPKPKPVAEDFTIKPIPKQ